MGNDKNKQQIEGNENSQKIVNISVNGNLLYLPDLSQEQVVQLINDTCTIDKEAVVDVVKEVIDEIEPQRRAPIEKRFFIPLVNQLSYSLDDNILKEAYKNLLKSSMNLGTVNNVHPAFISIINQLNSDEIKLLNSLQQSTIHLEPLIDLRMKIGKTEGVGIIHVSNFTDLGYGICQNAHKIGSYIENLERLKLIEIPFDGYLIDDKNYQKLRDHPAIRASMDKNQSKNGTAITYEFDKKFFHLTSFGLQFLKCCK